MDICTFWYEGDLRIVDRICLASMVMAARKVKLYSYERIKNLPLGVIWHDANEILDKNLVSRLNPHFPHLAKPETIVQFSDLFRIALMKKQKGLWLDTDVYLYKFPKIIEGEFWLAAENRQRLGVSVMYLPKSSPIVQEFDNYLAGCDILPSWLGWKRKYVKPILLKCKNKPMIAPFIGITIFGNDGVSRLAKKYNLFQKAKAKNSFYYWTGSKSARIYDAKYGLEPLQHKDFLGFHIHRKLQSAAIPEEGSFYYWAVKRVADFYNESIAAFFK